MQNYSLQNISKQEYIKSPKSSRLNKDDFENEKVQYYSINNCYYFSNYGSINYDYAPYFVEINNILFVAFYEKIYGLNNGQINLALELEFSLVGFEKYGEELFVITDGSIIRIKIDENMCYITNIACILSEGGFIVDYKLFEGNVLKLNHEDNTTTDYNLLNSKYIYPS